MTTTARLGLWGLAVLGLLAEGAAAADPPGKAKAPAKPEVLWSNDALTFTDEYELSVAGDVEAASFVDQQRPTLERMARDVARTLVTSITEAC